MKSLHFTAVDIDASKMKFDEKDEILEKALAKARKLKQKKELKDIISTIAEIKEEAVDDNIDVGNTIILNSTAEFCRTLGKLKLFALFPTRIYKHNFFNLR